MSTQPFDLNDRLVDFAAEVGQIVRPIPRDVIGHHVAGQLFRSGVAPAAHHAECQSAESRRDFIHKLRLALKELREARTWLRLIVRMQLTSCPTENTLKECEELIAVLVASVNTARRNRN